jgi:hypothetical protein
MAKSGRALASLSAAAWLFSCGGGSSSPASGGDIPLAELGPRVTTALCMYDVRCGVMPDQATCEAAEPADTARLVADVQAGRIVYDGAKAAQCLSAEASAICGFSDDAAFAAEPCGEIFTGTIAAGGACAYDNECVSQTCTTAGNCIPGVTCCVGSCQPGVGQLASGAACQPLSGASPCPQGSSCQADASGGATCRPLVAAGQPCANFGDCVAGAQCDKTGTAPGTCVAFPTEGQPCDPAGPPCSPASEFCDGATSKCAPRLGVGAACPAGQGCALYTTCDLTTMKCVAKGARGAACAGTASSDCLGGLECLNGACAPRAPEPVCP